MDRGDLGAVHLLCHTGWGLGGGAGTLGSDLTLHLVGVFVNFRCWTMHVGAGLALVPINFWRNSDPFEKKEHLSSSKNDRFRAFLVNLLDFP